MKPSPQMNRPVAALLAVLHAALGCSINYFFPLSLFLGTNAYLGTFFGVMALIFQGPRIGLAVMVAVACGGALRGDFGFLAVSCVEALVLAAYHKRGRRDVALADVGFWVAGGLWIVMGARLLGGLSFPEALLSGATIAVFNIFAVAIASLFSDYAKRLPASARLVTALGRRGDVPFRRIVFETCCALAMAPFIAFMVMTSATRITGLELEIGKRLSALTESYSRIVPFWCEGKRTRLESIVHAIASKGSRVTPEEMLETLMSTGRDVVSIGVIGRDGRIVSVAADEALRPRDLRGTDMSPVEVYRRSRASGNPEISVERDSAGNPLVCIVLPFGEADGMAAFMVCATDSLSALLDGIAGPTLSMGWLLGPDGSIVASNTSSAGAASGEAAFREAIEVPVGSYPAISGSPRDIARSKFVQYAEGGLGDGWKAAFVVNMVPLGAPVLAFALSLVLFALATIAVIVLVSAYASKLVVSSLEKLGLATRGFMERFLGREGGSGAESPGPAIEWPDEGIEEVVVLSRAFQEAGELLDARYRQTLAALGEAERASRAKRDLLSAVSHDIRGPIAGIIGVAERLESDLGERAEAEDVRLIRETGTQLNSFVEELLDRSAIEDGRLRLRSSGFDLRSLFDGAASVFRAAARRKGLWLEASFDESLPARVVGDRARLFQVLANLVGNAVKYTQSGGVHVSASFLAEDEGLAAIRFEVDDTGQGISPEDLGRIFDPYYRTGEGAASEEKGLGLGLSLARDLARLMGSEIEAESVVGGGSHFRFIVRLPVAEAGADPGEVPDSEPAPDRPIGVRVLLVDDADISRRHSRRILELAGCAVEEAIDGATAIDVALASEFDLILMDMDLPVLDGRAAARAILSRLGERPGARLPLVYALTAYSAESDEKSILASGFDGYIAKTGRSEPLEAAARRAAARRDAADPFLDAGAARAAGLAEGAGESVGERVLDIDGLLVAYRGNREFLVTLLQTFVSDGRRRIAQVRDSVARGDADGLAGSLHSLVNITGSGRAETALRLLRAWESAVRAGRPSGMAQERAALKAAEQAIDAAEAYLSGLDPRSGGVE